MGINRKHYISSQIFLAGRTTSRTYHAITLTQLKHKILQLQNRKTIPKLRNLSDTIQRIKETISRSEQVSLYFYFFIKI